MRPRLVAVTTGTLLVLVGGVLLAALFRADPQFEFLEGRVGTPAHHTIQTSKGSTQVPYEVFEFKARADEVARAAVRELENLGYEWRSWDWVETEIYSEHGGRVVIVSEGPPGEMGWVRVEVVRGDPPPLWDRIKAVFGL